MVNKSTSTDDIKSRALEGMNEENACMKLVVPYVTDVLGWSVSDIHAEYNVHKSNGKRVDYAVVSDDKPNFLVEVKSLGTNLQNKTDQLSKYLLLSDTDYGVLTDGIKCIAMQKFGDECRTVAKFEITEKAPDFMIPTEKDIAYESRSTDEFFEDAVDCLKYGLPDYLVDSFCVQYQSRFDKVNPIHMYFSVDVEMSSIIRDFILNVYEEMIYIRNCGSSEELLRSSSSPNVLVLDNIESGQNPNQSMISNTFDSVGVDESTGLPESKPLIVIDIPHEKRWSKFDLVHSQIRMEEPILNDIDLIYALNDSRTDEYDRSLVKEYFRELEYSKSESKIDINSKDNIDFNLELQNDASKYIEDFFTDIRVMSEEELESTITVNPTMIDTLVKMTRSIAIVESSKTVQKTHAETAVEIMTESLKDVGFDEEGRFNTGEMTKENRDIERRSKLVKIVEELEDEGHKGAPEDMVIETMVEKHGFENYNDRRLEVDRMKCMEFYVTPTGELVTT